MNRWLLGKGIPVNTAVTIFFFVMGFVSLATTHSHNICTSNGFDWFGIGEMPFMWWAMAVAHFLLHDCRCNKCNKMI
jgi:hypothetical protein